MRSKRSPINERLNRQSHHNDPARGASYLVALCSVFALCATGLPAHAQTSAVAIGKLTPFYRATQVQGHIPGHQLVEIPGYLDKSSVDVAYHRNATLRKEIPFVDTFTINRFLGGYPERWIKQYGNWDSSLGRQSLDYVVRKDSELVTRPEILRFHLDPYLQAGYRLSDITINLENVPWALARGGGDAGPFGQRNPPADVRDWTWTVRHLALDLKRQYEGLGFPGFKIGNEFNSKKSFNGSASDYFDLYFGSAEILSETASNSRVVPGEFSGTGTCTNIDVCVYDVGEFMRQARARGIVPRYIPRSLHAFQNSGNTMPSHTVLRAVRSYERLRPVGVEIHQFGLGGQPFGHHRDYGNDVGSRQAAWQFLTLMGLQEYLKPDRVFHWGGFSGYQRSDVLLLNGTGFLRLFLDRYLESDIYRLNASINPPDNISEIGAVAFRSSKQEAVIVGTFTPGTAARKLEAIISMPPGPLANWRFTRLTKDSDVFMKLKADLAADGNLKPEFAACDICAAEPQNMGLRPADARRLVTERAAKYHQIIQDTLRWKPIASLSVRHHDAASGVLRLELSENEVLVLERDRQS